MQADLLLGGHHVLVAGTENLVDLGDALCAVGHRSDSLNTANLENLADAGHAGCHQNGGVHLAVAAWRCAEHNLATAGDTGGSSQHQNGREEWGGAAGNVETYLLDGNGFLPAGDAGLRLHLLTGEALRLMEYLNIMVRQTDSLFQLVADQLFGFVHLFLAHGKLAQVHMVKLQLIALDGLVATLANIVQYGADGLV